MEPSDAARGQELSRALYLVAARAQFLRRALGEDSGEPTENERLRASAFQLLFDALDDLELAEPGVSAELAAAHDRMLATWRAEVEERREGGEA
jgi:hypothetical protein